MDLPLYLKLKQSREQSAEDLPGRKICSGCTQPDFSCYCARVERFDSKISFVILIHPLEQRRRMATGRLAHLSLENSHLISGDVFSGNEQVRRLAGDPEYVSYILYPKKNSIRVDRSSPSERRSLIPSKKKARIFVIDGTWATARKTINQSQDLMALPKLSFQPPRKSAFKVRKQPRVDCFSTVEAIHELIELFGDSLGFFNKNRPQDQMLELMNGLVNQQIDLTQKAYLAHGRKACFRTMKRRSI